MGISQTGRVLDVHYRRDIDGLRAFAVLPVILFHAGLAPFSGGYVGVDVFFVISGFLITSIILKDLERGTFSVWQFYERRARRILPALFVMTAVCIPVAWVLFRPFLFREFAQSVAAVSVYASNFLFWEKSGYFDTAAELKPLLHTWSLAVEEQYYLVVPFLMLLLWRLGRRSLLWTLVALALASLALSHWMAGAFPMANFYLLPSRAWELLAGALCAFVLAGGREYRSDLGAGLGLALIVGAVLVYTPETPFPSLYALAPVGGTALVILCAGRGTLVARMLGWAPLVGIGLISYSAYLWHQPLFAFTRTALIFEPEPLLMLALSGLSLGLGWLSWRFVERPFRQPMSARDPGGPARGPWLATRRGVFGATAVASLGFLAVGVLGSETSLHGDSWRAARSESELRANDLIAATVRRTELALDRETEAEGCMFRIERGRGTARYRLSDTIRERLANCRAEHGPGLAILGDSHARDLFGAITAATRTPFVVGFVEVDCHIHAPARYCQYEVFADFLAGAPEMFDAILVGQAGFFLLDDPEGGATRRSFFDAFPLDHRIPDYPIDEAGIDATATYLERLADHAQVVWIGPRPEPHIPRPLMIRMGCNADYRLRENQLGPYRRMERLIADRLANSPVSHISQIDAIDFDIEQDFMTCEALYWTDGDHLSVEGQHRFGPRILRAINALPALRTADLSFDLGPR